MEGGIVNLQRLQRRTRRHQTVNVSLHILGNEGHVQRHRIHLDVIGRGGRLARAVDLKPHRPGIVDDERGTRRGTPESEIFAPPGDELLGIGNVNSYMFELHGRIAKESRRGRAVCLGHDRTTPPE